MPIDDALFRELLQAPAQPQPEATPQAAVPAVAQGGAVDTQPSPTQGAAHSAERDLGASGARKAVQEDAASLGDLSKPGRDALGKPSDFLDAAVAGAGRAALETKDFITGEPAQKSETRQAFEKGAAVADQGGPLNPVISTISQFATGMLGAGKLLAAAKLVPAVEGAVGAVEAVKGGASVLQSTKAATVGAVAFDPHQERLSNLLEQVPVIGPPMFGWLAAHPDDSAAFGRAKAALESIGLDATLGAVFMAGAKVLKAVRGGSPEAVHAATQELQVAQEEHRISGYRIEPGPTEELTPGRVAGSHNLVDPEGNVIGKAGIQTEGDRATITWIEGPVDPGLAGDAGAANHLGPRAMRQIARSYFEQNPEINSISGERVSGARFSRDMNNLGDAETVTVTREQVFGKKAPGTPVEAPGAQGSAPATTVAETPAAVPTASPEAPTPRSMAEATGANDNTLGGPALDAPGTPPLSIEPGKPRVTPAVTVTPEEANNLVAGIKSDMDAIDAAGSVQGAVDEGHVFGKGANIPWNKLNLPGEVDDFVARVADSIEGQASRLKGGGVLEDARVHRQINGIASYFNMDPATIVGRIQQSGQAASRMVADMESAYLISNRMHTEAFNLANRITLGDFGALGSREAAMAEFQRQVTVAGSMLASGQSMRAAMGRGLRRLRPEFAIDPELVDRVQALGGDRLLKLFTETAGDPLKLKTITQKSFLAKALDEVGFQIQNNLLWGFGTHAVNFLSNSYMLAARPVEKAIGGAVRGDFQQVREALVQASYYPVSFVDGFSSVMHALKISDSVIDPRHTAYVLEAKTAAIRDGAFRPLDSVSGVLHDAYLLLSLPTRVLTASDEMMKQTIYRSHLASKAWGEGVDAGLLGRDLRDFIRQKVVDGFDEAGRAVDQASIQEARVATFSQDLTPTGWGGINTMGKTIRGAVASYPPLRLILPFTQTPTNLFRYTMQMTPGFNLMQQEYNHALMGKMGAEAQAHAIGQMALGSLALGSIAASSLNMTGGGPADPKIREEWMATGARPYSIVGQNDDGSRTYYPIGKIDPIAMPFGIVADIMDYMHATGDENSSKVQSAISTLAYSLVKQASNKTYLTGLANFAQAFSDPKQHLGKFLASSTMELVPASSALRYYNPDPYLREARSYVDNLMANVPGLSEGLAPRRDWAGNPVRERRDFLSTSPPDRLTAELQRMEVLGYSMVPPVPTVKHADLREVTMVDGRNAWDVYQQLAGKPTPRTPALRDQVAKIIEKQAYQKAPDGPVDVMGTKLFLLHGPVVAYRKAAEGLLMRDPNVRKAMLAATQKVNDAYQAAKAPNQPPPQAQAASDALHAIGHAFGVTQ